MNIELKEITVRELTSGYEDNEEKAENKKKRGTTTAISNWGSSA